MNKLGTLFCLIAFPVSLCAQAELELLVTDSSWTKEVFLFPLSFAPEIPFEGMEEACFPKRWADTTSAESWSYVFVWDIKRSSAITVRELEDNLQLYFNGLMGWQHTNAVLLKTGDSANISNYSGKIKTFDAFFSKKTMFLNVSISARHCSRQEKSSIVFRLSPKIFEHEIWQKLNTVVLRAPDCTW